MPVLSVQCCECKRTGANTEMSPLLRGFFICSACFRVASKEVQAESRQLSRVLNHIGKTSSIGYPVVDEREAEQALDNLLG